MFRPKLYPPSYNNGHYILPVRNVLLSAKTESTKKIPPIFRWKICEVLNEYCTRSTFHGLPYFVDRKRNWIERIWWIIAFMLSVSLCVNSIASIWWKWRDNLVVLTFSHKSQSIGEIPFPAVTICPLSKFSKEKLNYTDVYRAMLKLDGNKSRSVTEEELKIMSVASQLCEERLSRGILNMLPYDFLNGTTIPMIIKLLPTFEETMVSCKFFNAWTNCEDIFFPILTEEGICYTFNSLNINEITTDNFASDFNSPDLRNQTISNWDSEHGYKHPDGGQSYPYRVYGTGRHASLNVLLRIFKPDIDYLCSGPLQGFKIAIQPPNEEPQLWKNYFYVSPGQTAFIKIRPKLIITSKAVRKYNPMTRQCFFNSERQLRLYKQYTQRNCEMECLSNFTLTECGCVKFAMPRAKGDPICGPAKIECTMQADSRVFQSISSCNCLPSCSSLSYDLDVTQAEYNLVQSYIVSMEDNYDYTNATFDRLIISFSEEQFIPQKRSESNSLIDILANAGGLFGLFMGASLLSIAELLYYLTIRIFFARRQQHQMTRRKIPTPDHVFPFLP